ncbi:MAG: cell wall-binding repeat-containing protein [Dermatophilus congolensis]|nr:cell wall-binding repeat-containing protein [Dermatophilus congolensis]
MQPLDCPSRPSPAGLTRSKRTTLRRRLTRAAAGALCGFAVAGGGVAPGGAVEPLALLRPDVVLPPPNPGPVQVDPDAQGAPAGSQEPAATVRRVPGRSASDLSVAISREAFPYGASTAYLARADDLADALVAGQLTDGPILLLPRGSTAPAGVRSEIARLRPSRVVAVGGPAAVSQAALVSAAQGRRVGRISGDNAYATASAIARAAFGREADGSGGVAYVVSRTGLADGAVSGQLVDGPVLVAPPRVTAARIPGAPAALKGTVVGIGGTARLPDAVLRSLPARGGRTERIAGPDRYSTAAKVAARAFPNGASRVYIGSGSDLAGAVAAGAIADAAVLLAPSCGTLPPTVASEIRRLRPNQIVLLGDSRVLCTALEKSLGALH